MALLEREGIKKGSIATILHVCLGLVVVVSCAHALDLHTPGCKRFSCLLITCTHWLIAIPCNSNSMPHVFIYF